MVEGYGGNYAVGTRFGITLSFVRGQDMRRQGTGKVGG
jgi:hypothetical protein